MVCGANITVSPLICDEVTFLTLKFRRTRSFTCDSHMPQRIPSTFTVIFFTTKPPVSYLLFLSTDFAAYFTIFIANASESANAAAQIISTTIILLLTSPYDGALFCTWRFKAPVVTEEVIFIRRLSALPPCRFFYSFSQRERLRAKKRGRLSRRRQARSTHLLRRAFRTRTPVLSTDKSA